MLRSGKLVTMVAISVITSAANAQHPIVLNKLQEINAEAPQPSLAEIKGAVAATAKAVADANHTCAPTEVVVADVTPVTGARTVLSAVLAGQLRNGWALYATLSGCPGANSYRYMVLQKPDGSLVAPLVNEGTTYANPSIMRDTSAQAAMAAFQKSVTLDAKCDGKDMKMGPTRVSSQGADLGPDVYGVRYVGSWSEVWQFETCGKTFDVPVEFTADGDGGAYTNIKSADLAAVR